MGSFLFKSEPVITEVTQDTPTGGEVTDESYSVAEQGLEIESEAPVMPDETRILSASNAALSPAARSLVSTPISPEAPEPEAPEPEAPEELPDGYA